MLMAINRWREEVKSPMFVIGIKAYGWIPHHAGFGFLDFPATVVGENHFLDWF
jgi:hypothetical protein